MLLRHVSADERVTTAHQAKRAFVYVRQSSVGQIRHHQESTALQYRLVDRALVLGWPRERVDVIDEDLGKSGADAQYRDGFQRLIAEVGLGHAGLVLSFDASRLARNNRDWHQLLELCSLFSVLIADSERLYDPGAYHDRLLLGLSGIMSEAELHQIHLRLHQGERAKAARGELSMPLPAGLIRGPDDCTMLNPDAEVQERIRLVFAKFSELGTAQAVARYLSDANLTMPLRPVRGPAPQELVWRDATPERVRAVIRNPAYAGAYVYGRRRAAPERRRIGHLNPMVKVPREQWEVCLRDAHPGYIRWEEYMANVERLADNRGRFDTGQRGAPRSGNGLLQGLVSCGRCGRRMGLHYTGHAGEYPVYHCMPDEDRERCQRVRGGRIDAEVERLMLAALAPDRVALALSALDEMNADGRLLERQWALKRERARYEMERARRQYDAVEPENRLVARSLETLWEEKMRAAEHIEQEYTRWRDQQDAAITAAERSEIGALAQDLPRLWRCSEVAERKAILRLVISDIVLDQSRAKGKLWFAILWQTGARTEHWLVRDTRCYDDHAYGELIRERIVALNAMGRVDREIAVALNAEGLVNTAGKPFHAYSVNHLRQMWNVPTVKINGIEANPMRWPDGSWSPQGLAGAIGVATAVIQSWLRKGKLKGRRTGPWMPWQIDISDEEIARLKSAQQRNLVKG